MIKENHKRSVLKLVLVMSLGFVIATQAATETSSIEGLDSEPAPRWPQQPQAEDKPAEQVFKNIQILKGVPSSRLMPAMMRFAQFLGVDCSHCHVPNQFEKEDKPAKQTAREMFRMVRNINQQLNSNRVTCYTCHRGQPKPLSLPPAIAQPNYEEKTPEVHKPSALPTVDQLLARYLDALGGRAALARVQTRMMKGSLVTQGGMSAPMEVYEKAPNKSFTTFRNPMGVTKMGFDGTVGWTESPEQGSRVLSGKELSWRRFESEFHKELKVKQRYPKMAVMGLASLRNSKLGERDAYVIEATSAEGNAETWYLDRQTGLLVRVDFTLEGPEGKVTIQTRFEQYQDVNGVKVPFIIHRSRPGFTFTYKFDEVTLNVPIEDARFASGK